MYRELSEKEVKEFANMYLKEWEGDILEVSVIEYNNIREYMVNHHFLVIIKGKQVKKIDLQ